MKILAKILATFFGIGFFPVAPATLMSLIIVLLYKLYLHNLSWPLYLILLLVLFFTGVLVSYHYSLELKEKDPGKIVIDEACGQLIVLFFVPTSWFLLFLGFFLFRLFDIIKPYPIKAAENLQRGWGIMVDDIIAAFYAAIILNVYMLIK